MLAANCLDVAFWLIAAVEVSFLFGLLWDPRPDIEGWQNVKSFTWANEHATTLDYGAPLDADE